MTFFCTFFVIMMRLVTQDIDHLYVHETAHKRRRPHHAREHV